MRLAAIIVLGTLIISRALGSLTDGLPKVERPSVSLEEAAQITKAMLQLQGEEKKYYLIQAELFGGNRDEGARWIISLADSGRQSAMVFIMTKTPDCSLHYFPSDPGSSGKERKVRFRRNGVNVIRLKNEE